MSFVRMGTGSIYNHMTVMTGRIDFHLIVHAVHKHVNTGDVKLEVYVGGIQYIKLRIPAYTCVYCVSVI